MNKLRYCVIYQSGIQRDWVNLAWAWISGNFGRDFCDKPAWKRDFELPFGGPHYTNYKKFRTRLFRIKLDKNNQKTTGWENKVSFASSCPKLRTSETFGRYSIEKNNRFECCYCYYFFHAENNLTLRGVTSAKLFLHIYLILMYFHAFNVNNLW